MKEFLDQILRHESLTRAQAADLLAALTEESASPTLAGAILAALRSKGETADELAGFAEAMRRLARRPSIPVDRGSLVDIVGTGGDGACSYNLSTGSALLASACGLRVAKHGNRAVSSACGSADVLQALGLPLPLRDNAVAECFKATGFTFLFAPDYHSAMAAIAPVRRALGVRTIFNMLGPLTNPAQPGFGVIGAYSLDAARTIAGALSQIEITRYFVVHGAAGWDEPTPIGSFCLLDVVPGYVRESVRDPREYGLPRCTPEDLRGGSAEVNAIALTAALGGAPGHLGDALVLGAALALEVAGLSKSICDCADHARRAITDGRATRTLESIREFGKREWPAEKRRLSKGDVHA